RCRSKRISALLQKITAKKAGPCRAAGPWVLNITSRTDVNHLFAFELVLIVIILPAVFQDLVLHLRENSRPVEVIVLRPAVEGMIMALGALQARSEEKLGDRFRSRRRFPVCAIKVCGRILIAATAG